jgi:ribosomal protein S12 methylthiotransferase accessory factor
MTPDSPWMTRAVGARYGLVQRCEELPRNANSPLLHISVARGPRFVPGSASRIDCDGTGVSCDRDTARRIAIAESMERYCAQMPPSDAELTSARYTELAVAAVHPGLFAGFSHTQVRDIASLGILTPDTLTQWCVAHRVNTDSKILVPASFIYRALQFQSPSAFLPEGPVSGFACNTSWERAAMSGLSEVLERDALSIMWLNVLPLTVLDPVDTRVEFLLQKVMAPTGLCFDLYRIPSDSPLPVVLAVASRSGEGGSATVVGMGCRVSAVDAAEKAIYECCQVLAWLHSHDDHRPRAIIKLTDHALLYASTYGAELLRRHLKPGGKVQYLAAEADRPVADAPLAFSAAVRQLSQSGRDVLVADITTPDVKTLGMRVVKVIIPGALDISGNPQYAQLGAERLYRVPVDLGLLTERRSSERMNLLPVPLA